MDVWMSSPICRLFLRNSNTITLLQSGVLSAILRAPAVCFPLVKPASNTRTAHPYGCPPVWGSPSSTRAKLARMITSSLSESPKHRKSYSNSRIAFSKAFCIASSPIQWPAFIRRDPAIGGMAVRLLARTGTSPVPTLKLCFPRVLSSTGAKSMRMTTSSPSEFTKQ